MNSDILPVASEVALAKWKGSLKPYAWRQLCLERDELRRLDEIEAQGRFGETFRNKESNDETISYAYWAQAAAAVYDQFELDLSGPNFHAAIRQKMAERFRSLFAKTGRARYARVAQRLSEARLRGGVYYSLRNKKFIKRWDKKAGLARYCPDDSREESQRLSKRYLPKLMECHRAGYRIYYCVLTTPSRAVGELKKMQREQMNRFKRMIRRKYDDGSKVFPELKGALLVQESPLGWNREWHAHLNVLFVVDGFLDFGKLRHHWGNHLHIDPPLARGLDGEAAERCIGGALREIIKYAVAAVSAKSEKKARSHEQQTTRRFAPSGGENVRAADDGPERAKACGRSDHGSDRRHLAADRCSEGDEVRVGAGLEDPPGDDHGDRVPPGMIDYSDDALMEWDSAQLGHKRTRSYLCLNGIKKPPKEDLGQLIFVGWRRYTARGYQDELPLLRSITEDKFSGTTASERWLGLIRSLALGKIAGAGRLGESIPSHFELPT